MAKKKKLAGVCEKGAKETIKRRKDLEYVRDDLEEYLADCGINCVTPKRVKDTVDDSGDDLEEDLADCSLDHSILVPDEIRGPTRRNGKTLEDSVQILEDETEDELDSSVLVLERDQEDSNCRLFDSGRQLRDSGKKAAVLFSEVDDATVHPLNTVIVDGNTAEIGHNIGINDYSECASELDASVISIDESTEAFSDPSEKNGEKELLDRDVDLDASVIILNVNNREAPNLNEHHCSDNGKKCLERDVDGQIFPVQIENQVLEGIETESDLEEDDVMAPNLCDSVNQLLESDDEDLDSEDEVRSKEEEIREGEVVWRLWYRGSTTKKRVKQTFTPQIASP